MAENNLKILAIDDKPDNLTVVSAVAADAFPGATVFTAGDGAKGLEIARTEDPDVILLDVVMPGMDGFEVCRKLKADPRLADIPVVFLTAAKIKNELRVKALEAGAEAFLSKPFEEADLVSQVRAMAKIKAGNLARRAEKERLALLLKERTHELVEESDEHQRTAGELAQAEGRYGALFSRMTEGFALHEIICDKNGKPVDYRFLELNPAFEKMTGIARASAVGHTALELMPGLEKRWIEAYGHVALTQETLSFEEFAGPLGKYFAVKTFSPRRGQFAVIFSDVTERRRSEQAVRRSEALLRGILDNMQDAYVRTDTNGRFVMVSPSAVRMYGYSSAAEMLGLPTEALYMSKTDQQAIVRQLQSGGRVVDRIGQGRRKDGSWFWVSLNAQLVRDDQGKVAGMEGAVRDITERKQAEDELLDANTKLELALRSSNMGVWHLNIAEDKRFFDAQACRLLGLDPDTFRGTTGEFFAAIHPDDHALIRAALKQTIERNVLYEPDYRAVWPDGSVHYLTARAKLQSDESGKPLLSGVLWDITGRKRMEEDLAAEKKQVDAILESSPVGLLVFDEKRNVARANSAAAAICGAELKDMPHKRCGDALGCVNAARDPRGCGYSKECPLCPLRENLEALLDGGAPLRGLEMRMELLRDGKPREVWLLVGTERITIDGRRYAVVSLDDITAKKAAQAAEEKSRVQYAAIFGHSPIAIEHFDADGALVGINAACAEMFGVVNIKEIAGFKIFDDPNLPDGAKDRLRKRETVRVELSFDFEKVKKHKLYTTTRSGISILDYQIVPMIENNQVTGFVAQIQDITARRRAEDALRKSEEQHRTILQTAMDGFWLLDSDGRLLEANNAYARMSGYSVPELQTMSIPDLEAAENEADVAVHRRKIAELGSDRFESRHRRKDGTVFDVSLSVQFRPEDGGRSVAFIQDITERKRVEQALQDSEQRFSDAFEHTGLGMALLSVEGRWLKVNAAMCGIMGYTQEELLGKAFRDITHPDDRASSLDNLRSLLSGGIDSFKAEKRYIHRSGRTVWAWLSVTLVRDDSGEPLYFVTQVSDITARKKAETAMQRHGELLAAITTAGDLRGLMERVTGIIANWTGCEAVGIRLRDGEDFPYYETRGFPAEFVRAENSLCVRDAAGELCRNNAGTPVLECMCGNVLCGRFDPKKPFFTPKGSFWSNCTTELLASTTDADRQARTRNRCNGQGYESVALIPLRSGVEILGLLQLNDRHKGRFDGELLSFLEHAADQLAIAVSQLNSREALRVNEERLKKAQTTALVGNWEMNLKTREFWASDEARRIYGFALTEELTLDKVKKIRHIEELPEMELALKRLVAGEAGYDQEFEIVQQNTGAVKWIHSKAELALDKNGATKIVGVIQDITARKQAEKVLQDLIEKNPMSIQIVDPEGFTLKVNPAFTRLFLSVPPAGFSIFADIRTRTPEFYEFIQRAKNGEVVHLPDTYYNPHDALPGMPDVPVWLHAVIFPLKDSEGKVEKLVLMHENITERKLADDKIKASLAEKEVLMKEIHHRVKNNLQVVSSLLNLQAKTVKDESALSVLKESRARVRAMALVHEILYRSNDFSRLNMREYADRLIDGLKGASSTGGKVRFETDICDCRLSVDTAVSLGLILSELVSNALKHAFPEDREGVVKISLAAESGGYCLSVADDGPGLPADYDLRKSASLGMQLVSTLAGQISGTVEADGGKKGARFVVRFPG